MSLNNHLAAYEAPGEMAPGTPDAGGRSLCGTDPDDRAWPRISAPLTSSTRSWATY